MERKFMLWRKLTKTRKLKIKAEIPLRFSPLFFKLENEFSENSLVEEDLIMKLKKEKNKMLFFKRRKPFSLLPFPFPLLYAK